MWFSSLARILLWWTLHCHCSSQSIRRPKHPSRHQEQLLSWQQLSKWWCCLQVNLRFSSAAWPWYAAHTPAGAHEFKMKAVSYCWTCGLERGPAHSLSISPDQFTDQSLTSFTLQTVCSMKLVSSYWHWSSRKMCFSFTSGPDTSCCLHWTHSSLTSSITDWSLVFTNLK